MHKSEVLGSGLCGCFRLKATKMTAGFRRFPAFPQTARFGLALLRLHSILNASTPFFTVLAAHYLTDDERLTGKRLAGVFLGVAGVVYMIGSEALDGLTANAFAQSSAVFEASSSS